MNGQVCVSIGHCPMIDPRSIHIPTEWAEVRFDLLEGFHPQDSGTWHSWIIECLARFPRLIATYRQNLKTSTTNATREQVLTQALALGVRYVDVDLHEEPGCKQRLLDALQTHSAHLIHSVHLGRFPASQRELEGYVEQLLETQPFLAKLAVPCNGPEEVDRVMALYARYRPLLAIAMGPAGRRSRIEACEHGAPYSYGYLSNATGPGQLSAQELFAIFRQTD